jgi:hypothetical protein
VKNRKKICTAKPFKKLYFGYGANTNKEAMAHRCPDADAVGVVSITDHRLVFRGVADVEPHKGSLVRGALWEITADDEAALDRFEGFPHLYVKTTFPLVWKKKRRDVMLYIMRSGRRDYALPSAGYEETLRDGYGHFGIDDVQIDKAMAHARLSEPKKWVNAPYYLPSRKHTGWNRRTQETWGEYMLPTPTGYNRDGE